MDYAIILFIIFSIIIIAGVFITKGNKMFIFGLLGVLLVNMITLGFDYKEQTTCTEVWSGTVSAVSHTEEWNEFHPAWDEKVSYKDSKGKRRTKTVHHKAYTEHHDAENYITTTDDGKFSVNVTPDGQKLTDSFVNSDNELKEYFPIGMPTASTHTYENKVQASYSIYKHKDIYASKYTDLPAYPQTVEHYCINRLVGKPVPNQTDCEKLLNKYNSDLNDTNNSNNTDGTKSYKQVNLIFVNMGDVSDEYGYVLQDYWKNGNKNDFIIAYGSSDDKVTWCYPFSWSESELLKEEVRDYILDNPDLSKFEDCINYTYKDVEDKFERKQFADFSYLQIELSKSAKIIILILDLLMAGACILLCGYDCKHARRKY